MVNHKRNYAEDYEDYSNTELGIDIAELRYDGVADILLALSVCFHIQSINDKMKDRTKLSKVLEELSNTLKIAANQADEAWKICEPYMKE